MIATEKQYYPGLTGLRAFAVFLVYLHHFNPIPDNWNLSGYLFKGIVNEFYIGVTVFFVLSGFLITQRYFEGGYTIKKYLWNRISRIYPIYFLLTTITLFFIIFNEGYLNENNLYLYFLNITFLRGFIESTKFSFIAQGWSLTVEETFYILAPIIFCLGRKSIINLLIFPLFLVVIGISLSFIFRSTRFWGGVDFTMNYTFFGRCTEFFIGIFASLFLRSLKLKGNKDLYIIRFYKPLIFILLVIILAFVLNLLALYYQVNFGIRTFGGMFINTFLFPTIVVGPFILSLCLNEGGGFFESKLMQILGKSSYVFYLIHVGIIRAVIEQYIVNGLMVFIILVFLSILMWFFVEETIHKKLKPMIK